MNSSLVIEQAGEEGFELAFDLLRRFYAEEGFTTSPAAMRASLTVVLRGPDSAVFLAWRGGQAVGIATVTTVTSVEDGRVAELEDLYVLPEARGGVGRALIDRGRTWAQSRGCTSIAVIVTPEGQAAHDLIGYYRAYGFRTTERTLLVYQLEEQ